VITGFNSAGGGAVLAGMVLVLLLVYVLVKMMRSRKPHPKMELLPSLMQDFPRENNGEDPAGGSGDDADPRQEHGPLGPGGFSHIAAEQIPEETEPLRPAGCEFPHAGGVPKTPSAQPQWIPLDASLQTGGQALAQSR
jgi:hypothetical protein